MTAPTPAPDAEPEDGVDRLLDRGLRAVFGGTPTTPPERGAAAPDALPLPPPARFGRFAVVGELGRGGLGVVYRARDGLHDRDVAVKTLRPDRADRPDLAARLEREARLAGSLQHPGIVAVYDSGRTDDGRFYFAMRLVEGRPFDGVLRARGSPAEDLPRHLRTLLAAAEALAHAHARRVVHRDVKPANVLVGAFGEVQLADWGLAKRLADPASSVVADPPAAADPLVSRRGVVVGTPAYMAPEQARGEIDRVDERSDVFALGAVLAEILTGAPPWRASTPDLLRAAAAEGRPAAALEALSVCGADPELLALARASLEADPAARPPHAGAFAAALETYLVTAEDRARRSATAAVAARERADLERRAKRRGFALAAVVVVQTALLAWWHVRTERGAERRALEAERRLAPLLADAESASRDAARRPADVPSWEAARAAAERAAIAADGTDVPAELAARARESLRRAVAGLAEAAAAEARRARDEDAVRRLDAIRGMLGAPHAQDDAFAAAFASHGVVFGAAESAPAERDAALAALAARPVARDFARALDVWSTARRHARRNDGRAAFAAAAAVLDPDPLRVRIRGAAEDAAALAALAESEAAAVDADPLAREILATALVGAGDAARGYALLRRAEADRPDDFWTRFEAAAAARLLDPPRTDLARLSLTAATALRPRFFPAWINLGTALGALGDRAGALDALSRAAEVAPAEPLPHYNRGSLLLEAQALDEAAAAFREALDRDPRFAYAEAGLGRIAELRGDAAAAEALYRKTLRAAPGYGFARRRLGTLLLAQNRGAEAVAELKRAAEDEPRDATLRVNLGVARRRAGDFDGARSEFRAALALDPRDAFAAANLGDLLIDADDAVEALRVVEDVAERATSRAGAHAPEFAPAAYVRGRALLALGEPEAAFDVLSAVFRADPRHARAATLAGRAALESGRPQDALSFYDAARALPTTGATGERPADFEIGVARDVVRLSTDDAEDPHAAEELNPSVARVLAAVRARRGAHAEAANAYSAALAGDDASWRDPRRGLRRRAAEALARAAAADASRANAAAGEIATLLTAELDLLEADLGSPAGRRRAARFADAWCRLSALAPYRAAPAFVRAERLRAADAR